MEAAAGRASPSRKAARTPTEGSASRRVGPAGVFHRPCPDVAVPSPDTGHEGRILTPLELPNRLARRLWLHLQGLGAAPASRSTHADALATVERLGMVQLDPLAPVARAHHHILWSRHSDWRPARYDTLLERRRSVFEHFTHDAAILPMTTWPWWARTRRLRAERYARGHWGAHLPPERERLRILERVAREGPLCSADFEGGARADRSVHAWMRPPHKLALEHLWLEGRLAVARRRRFAKHYDLVERVVPDALRAEVRGEPEQIDFLCRAALARLGFATVGELQRFWDAVSASEVRDWLGANPRAWRPVRVEGADGAWREACAPADVEDALAALGEPPARARILNPFDPVVRDRARLARLFGFDYRIEIYVPAARRRYGWYVYPVLDGARFVGRIEARVWRETDRLRVTGWWPEPGLGSSAARARRIGRELARFARLGGAATADPLPAASAAGAA